ncbi:MAG: hypothetical protein EA357_04185 [Micavibrio sp.]|jgi:hypothetical protein|nr:MAG: hypothetical protein EA357_04185 [Micavibrio sp.]
METPKKPVLYTRKYTKDDDISFDDLRTAYRRAARLVDTHGKDYLPVFERLERELQERQHEEALLARAKEVARQRKTRPQNSLKQ